MNVAAELQRLKAELQGVVDDCHGGAAAGDLARIVQTPVGVLIDSAILLHEAFGTGAAPRYQSYKEIVDAVREEYSAAAG